ncbi:MAG: dihydrofolate reductase [Candidatus Methylomirabilota bacterium]|nr:dihydrofolate reductase [candidate division NC10 bacterium]PWB46173.1 MAG: dihydrofolate reductase [candidate division NC10 bacterium]
MNWRILVSAPYMQPIPEKYRTILEKSGCQLVVPPVQERLSEEELLGLIEDIDGVISGDDRFSEKVYQAAKRLKVVSKWGTGIDSLKKEIASKYGVIIRNTPNAFTEPVADTVLGYILCFARRLPWMDRDMKNGTWKRLSGTSLHEQTLGVIGVGNIGKAVIRRAAAFGMRVLGNDIIEIPRDFLERTTVEMVSKEELLKQSDFVSLNCDLNPTSYHLMSGQEFGLMKREAYLINTARGSVVDEPKLVKALEDKKIAGAGLDVFEVEPLPHNSLLRRMDNVLMAPHNSNASPSVWERIHEATVKNLLEELRKP